MNEIREYSLQQLDDQARAAFNAYRSVGRSSRNLFLRKDRIFVKWVLIVDAIAHKTILRVVHGDELGSDRQNLDFEL